MRRDIPRAAGILLSAAIAFHSAAADEVAFPLNAGRVLFLGDSITHAGHYISIIDAQTRCASDTPPEWINLGLPSETCSGLSEPEHPFPRPNVHERIDRALEKLDPDVVVVCYGMNDAIYYPFDEERFAAYRRGIDLIIDKVHTAGAKLILMTPPAFDPLPPRKQGKLSPRGAPKYSWRSIYEDYDDVIRRYARWVMDQADRVEMVIDLHTPVSRYLAAKRIVDPQFTMSPDGVHLNREGHGVLAKTILAAWNADRDTPADPAVMELVSQRQQILHHAWLSEVGHRRPGTKPGLPIEEAQSQAAEIEKQIDARVKRIHARPGDASASGVGRYWKVHYPASEQAGELSLLVDYFLWVPPGVEKLRGIIVHQHGCGVGASIGGLTAADDLHWQALAAKWNCGLMGSSYQGRAGESCRLWCDPRNGSAARFLQSLDHFADVTGYPELNDVPWCLWGHSGGGFWASLMQVAYPQRIAAIWLQSGTAFGYWQQGEVEAPRLTDAVFQVPVMACSGIKEKDHERFRNAWQGLTAMTKAYREKDAPFGFVADPVTGHECGDSRYLAIPFFDACLQQRLPPPRSADSSLHVIDRSTSWYASALGDLLPADRVVGDVRQLIWLPTKEFANKWKQFSDTGAVDDTTPPTKPAVTWTIDPDAGVTLSWHAVADFESGIAGFRIQRDGQTMASLPESPLGRFGRPLFQTMSYHDTPELPLPEMRFVDDSASPATAVYELIAINSVGLESEPARVEIESPAGQN